MNIVQVGQWIFGFLKSWGFSIVAAVLIATSFLFAIAVWDVGGIEFSPQRHREH